MKYKRTIINTIEMAMAYVMLILIVVFSPYIVKLGNAAGVKMLLTVMVYVIFAAVPLIIMKLRKIPFKSLGFSKANISKQLSVAAAIFIVTISVAVVIPLLAGLNKTDVLSFKVSSLKVLIFYVFYDIICVGFGEEVAFRGYFYSRIRDTWSAEWLAVLASAFLFGLFHFPNTMNLINVAMTSILGLGYGFCRWKIKNCSLLSLALAHGLHDAVITILSYVLL